MQTQLAPTFHTSTSNRICTAQPTRTLTHAPQAVIASLTSTAGAASSAFTNVPLPRGVDDTVDLVMASVFDKTLTSFLTASSEQADVDEL